MTAAVTNPFKLTWGSFVVGGTNERMIVGIHRISRDFNAWSATFDVLVHASSDGTFATVTSGMESEFSKRRQAILFQVGASTIHTFDPTDGVNTGLNSWARIEKIGSEGYDTDRSRLYTVSVGCDLPATDTSGRRDSQVIVDYDPAQRRTVTIRGTWTAVTTNEATAQYAASIAAYASSVLGALLPAGTFELIQQHTDADDQDKILEFTRTYREIDHISDTILTDANIVEATIAWERSIDQPGDSGGGNVKRLETISASFSCFLDYVQSTDLETLYTGTVRPYIISQMQSKFSPAQFAILHEGPTQITYGNQLNVTVTFQASIDPTDVIESVETSRLVESSGVVLTGAWTGGLFDKYADQGLGTRRKFSIRALRVLGTLSPGSNVGEGGNFSDRSFAEFSSWAGNFNVGGFASFFNQENNSDAFGAFGVQGGGGGWQLIDSDSAATPKWLGQPGGDQIAVTDLVEQVVEEWVDEPRGS